MNDSGLHKMWSIKWNTVWEKALIVYNYLQYEKCENILNVLTLIYYLPLEVFDGKRSQKLYFFSRPMPESCMFFTAFGHDPRKPTTHTSGDGRMQCENLATITYSLRTWSTFAHAMHQSRYISSYIGQTLWRSVLVLLNTEFFIR